MTNFELIAEQARILIRESERAEAEGREILWPTPTLGLERRRPPELTREQLQALEQRRRAKASRATARQRGSTGTSRLTPEDLLARQDRRCYLCHKPLKPADVQIDHIIPIAKGGLHEDTNLAAACQPCNTAKADRILAFNASTRQPHYVGAYK